MYQRYLIINLSNKVMIKKLKFNEFVYKNNNR